MMLPFFVPIPHRLIYFGRQRLNQLGGPVHLDVKPVVNNAAVRVDNNRPGCAPRPVFSHDFRYAVAVGITSRMCHGDHYIVFYLIAPELMPSIETVAFEHRLHR